jgi:pilus assembly protein FimV
MLRVISRIQSLVVMNKKNRNAVGSMVCATMRQMRQRLLVLVGTLAFGLVFGLAFAPVHAVELGHSRVASAPGEPLVVVIPVLDVAESDVASLTIRLADASQWQAAGLTPPVALDSLSLKLQAGRNAAERLIRVTSPQVSEQTVIDMLVDVSTASASRTLQTSIIVAPPPSVRLAGQIIVVRRGDTLIGIAEQFPVEGANLYQELWALYSGNTDAFIRENMNLLKAGASLRIPDADTVRAVDPAFAKAQYLAHVRAFRQVTGSGQGDLGIAANAQTQTLQAQPQETPRGEVEPAPTEPPAPVNDQVRLTAADTPSAAVQADIATSAQKQKAEEADRQQALEQNIDALRAAVSQLQGDATNDAPTVVGEPVDGSVSTSATGAAADVVTNATEVASARPSSGDQATSAAMARSTDAASGDSDSSSAVGAVADGVTNGTDTASARPSSGDRATSAATARSTDAASGDSNSSSAVGAVADGVTNGTDSASARPSSGDQVSTDGSVTGSMSGSMTDETTDDRVSSSAQANGSVNRDAPSGSDATAGGTHLATATNLSTDDKANEPLNTQNAFERASQWVSNNVTAAIALLLALIALILAWTLRSGKDKTVSPSGTEPHIDRATAKFEEKLKEIDLSLDDQPAQTHPEQTSIKPDQKG